MEKDPRECVNLWDHRTGRDVRSHMTDSLLGWLAAQERRLGSRGGDMMPGSSQRLDNSQVGSMGGRRKEP